MVDVDLIAKRIVSAEKSGRKLARKTIFKMCGYDRSVMREVFRRIRLMKQEEETLGKWMR
jgi:hypothetical protein